MNAVVVLDDGRCAVCIPGEPIRVYEKAADAETYSYAARSLASFLNRSIDGGRLGEWMVYRDKAIAELNAGAPLPDKPNETASHSTNPTPSSPPVAPPRADHEDTR